MIKVKTKVGDIILINNTIHKTFEEIFTIPGLEKGFKYFGKLSQLDKELEEFVEKHPNINYRDYLCSSLLKAINGWTANWICLTPKQSFISLIKSQHPEFQEDKEYLLIKLI